MRLTRRVCAIGMLLWPTVAIGRQSAPVSALPEPLRAHVQNERFQIVTSIRGLPLGVRGELERLFGNHGLDIAEPGAAFQAATTAGDLALPSRRLVAAGCSIDHCLVYYERGGGTRTWRAALFHWTPAATRLELGGVAPGGLATVDAIRTAVLSGSIKRSNIW